MKKQFFSRQGAAWLLIFSILLLFSCSGDGSGSDNQVLWFSDIHFDPFADPDIVVELAEADHADWGRIFSRSTIHGTFPSTGHETNYRLLRESLRDMRGHAPAPDFILFTGDFLAHHFNENYAALTGDAGQAGLRSFIDKTLTFLVDQILVHYPHTPVFFCLGNNDSYEGDYLLTPNSPFLASSARILAPLLKSEADRTALAATYSQGGQYELSLPGANARLLALNSVFLSPHAPGGSAGAAREQLDWLESRLGAAAQDGARVWILLHTPPGVDVFATRRSNPGAVSPARIVPLLREEHLARLNGILLRHQDHVAAMFAGHIHRDDFRLFRAETGAAVATFVVPAISPVFANNPAYKILTYDPATLTIQDSIVHYLNPGAGAWQTGQVFSRAYGPGELSPQRMGLLWADLRDNPGIRDQYASAYAAFRTPAEITDQNFPYYWNAIGVLDSASYRRAFLEQRSAPGAATPFVHEAHRPLFRIADAWSGSPAPGAHVICANKMASAYRPESGSPDTDKGEAYGVWSYIAISPARDRTAAASLFIEDAGLWTQNDSDHDLAAFLDAHRRNVAQTIVDCGRNQNVLYNRTYIGYAYRIIPPGHLGAAVTVAPYVTLARKAVPDEGFDVLNRMTLKQWENSVGFGHAL